MNIAHIVGEKYNYKSTSYHRHLNGDPINGTIASGYLCKDTNNGNHIDMITKSYHGVLILSGSGVYIDDKFNYKIKSGDFFQRLPNVKHTSLVTSDDYVELYINLGKNIFEALSQLNVTNSHNPVLHPGIDFETIQTFLHLQDQLSFVDLPELPLLIPQFVAYIARINYLSKTNSQSTAEKDLLAMATIYIQTNIYTRITVEEVAAYLNIGYEKFRKLFTAHYNISPGNYIIHQRINKSQRLLSQGDLSIKEIAYQLGYVDTYTFSKQFKKITGRTPSDFQNLYVQL